ncbi:MULTISPECIES: MarR family winged helix-turn-helix transcriptional regulator [unclassified Streptomyces]|uniref:MarR family winged helix-turn-helix transcriptional regulator n=1 Tax=unclassified Streptomyces TaxID=2593676 RepID=UPI000A467601|nr:MULTISPECIES: MarR family transcriptional regulator [unclassified Streptomyces]
MTSKRTDGRANSSTVTPLLEDDFGFAIGVIFRAYARAVEATVADLPGGPRGYFILAAAVRGEAGSQRFLADRLGVDRTMMTYLLDDLEEAGLVERKPDPADRRSRQIIATPHGAELWKALHAEVDEIDRRLLSALPEESQTAFRDMLYAIARQVSANEQKPTGDRAADPAGAETPARVTRRRRARPNA